MDINLKEDHQEELMYNQEIQEAEVEEECLKTKHASEIKKIIGRSSELTV